MIECRWLPDLVYCNDLSKFADYQYEIYQIFKNDFIISCPQFNRKPVLIRKEPIEYGKEEAFYHVTCQDYEKDGERVPDLRRCERIRWVRSFIENYNCNSLACEFCEGIKIWDEPRNTFIRTHILLEEERYLVVVEKRPKYCLLITAFYYDRGHSMRNALKRYMNYKSP